MARYSRRRRNPLEDPIPTQNEAASEQEGGTTTNLGEGPRERTDPTPDTPRSVPLTTAKHARRRRRGSPAVAIDTPEPLPDDAFGGGKKISTDEDLFDQGTSDAGTTDTTAVDGSFVTETSDLGSTEPGAPDPAALGGAPTAATDWFGPSEPGEGYAAQTDVSLASMLMLGTSSYQRIDGMGLARKALEAPVTGNPRRDLSDEERSMLANARAWCLLVHGDLGHRSRVDDPFVLADAERNIELARSVTPDSPYVETTLALQRLRQGRTAEALESAQRALAGFARVPDHQRDGRTQGAAILATVTLALAAAVWGDLQGARALGAAARAVRTPLDLDDTAFSALIGEVDEILARAS